MRVQHTTCKGAAASASTATADDDLTRASQRAQVEHESSRADVVVVHDGQAEVGLHALGHLSLPVQPPLWPRQLLHQIPPADWSVTQSVALHKGVLRF